MIENNSQIQVGVNATVATGIDTSKFQISYGDFGYNGKPMEVTASQFIGLYEEFRPKLKSWCAKWDAEVIRAKAQQFSGLDIETMQRLLAVATARKEQ